MAKYRGKKHHRKIHPKIFSNYSGGKPPMPINIIINNLDSIAIR